MQRTRSITIIDMTGAAFVSGSPVTNIAFGPTYVGNLKSFTSYVTVTGNSAVTGSVSLHYLFGPFQDGPYIETTATSLDTAAYATAVLTANHFVNNHLAWMKILVGTSQTAGYASGTLRAILCGTPDA